MTMATKPDAAGYATMDERDLRVDAINEATRQVIVQLSKNYLDNTTRLENWRDSVKTALRRRTDLLSAC